jgi:hypothetical protein
MAVYPVRSFPKTADNSLQGKTVVNTVRLYFDTVGQWADKVQRGKDAVSGNDVNRRRRQGQLPCNAIHQIEPDGNKPLTIGSRGGYIRLDETPPARRLQIATFGFTAPQPVLAGRPREDVRRHREIADVSDQHQESSRAAFHSSER